MWNNWKVSLTRTDSLPFLHGPVFFKCVVRLLSWIRYVLSNIPNKYIIAISLLVTVDVRVAATPVPWLCHQVLPPDCHLSPDALDNEHAQTICMSPGWCQVNTGLKSLLNLNFCFFHFRIILKIILEKSYLPSRHYCYQLVCANVFSFDEIIGQTIKLFLTGFSQNSAKTDKSGPAIHHDIGIFTLSLVTRNSEKKFRLF